MNLMFKPKNYGHVLIELETAQVKRIISLQYSPNPQLHGLGGDRGKNHSEGLRINSRMTDIIILNMEARWEGSDGR